MNKQQLADLKKQVIKRKSMHEANAEARKKEFNQLLKEKNLQIGNDEHLEEIVDIDMALEEKYDYQNIRKKFVDAANQFIMKTLDYIIKNQNDPRTKNLEELKEMLTEHPTWLTIKREELLDTTMKYDGIPTPTKEEAYQ